MGRHLPVGSRRANLPCRTEDEAYDVAEALDRKHKGEPLDYWLRLRVADVFRTQAAHYGEDVDWLWEPDEYIESMAGIRLMVNHLNIQIGKLIFVSEKGGSPLFGQAIP